jgi:hypothetical protein
MRRFIIEREITGVGTWDACALEEAARTSNTVLEELGPRIQWQHSYVAGDKTFCVYLAEDEEAIRMHSEKSGFPASCITEISGLIDPTTAAS